MSPLGGYKNMKIAEVGIQKGRKLRLVLSIARAIVFPWRKNTEMVVRFALQVGVRRLPPPEQLLLPILPVSSSVSDVNSVVRFSTLSGKQVIETIVSLPSSIIILKSLVGKI